MDLFFPAQMKGKCTGHESDLSPIHPISVQSQQTCGERVCM